MGDISFASTSAEDHVDSKLEVDGTGGGGITGHEGLQNPSDHELSLKAQHLPPTLQHAFTAQLDMAQPPVDGRSGPYNMGSMANSLPQIGFRPPGYPHATQQRYNAGASPSMMPQMPQYIGHPSMPMAGQSYYVQQPQMTQYYSGQLSPTQPTSSMSPRQNMAYYPNQMMVNHPQSTYYYTTAPQQYPASTHTLTNTMMAGQYPSQSPVSHDPRALSHPMDHTRIHRSPAKQGQDGADRRQSTVRGPPRKPRQSGHAIWIGNLPPQTDLMSLVHHVCKEAPGLESLFLISKSNCAFANFKDEATCSSAQHKLHDSKFQSVRLVSRLRKSTVEGAAGVTAPTGPAVGTASPIVPSDPTQDGARSDGEQSSPVIEQPKTQIKNMPVGAVGETVRQKDKFFILKSLTVEDLELSVRTGIWATQSHNEVALNNAFQTVENVYLVFSANKSGEYFGYARMISNINEDPAAAIEFAPKAQATSDLDLPKAIPTEATEFAPKGRIIDDSARGTIFWEAEREDSEGFSDAESDVSSGKSAGAEDGATQTWGKPFKLEWLSTTRLPFYRTRGLRNPWNSNREVKIARDGTELEPSIGRRLIGLFNRVQSPGPVPAGMRVQMAMMPGYPQMRPYGR